VVDVTWIYGGLILLSVVGAVFAVALATLRRWVAFLLFLAVFVIGVMALTVQVVMSQ
jgi:hypothetical protein